MPAVELAFQQMINTSKFLSDVPFFKFYVRLFKFTIELLYDNRAISKKYIIPENEILYSCPKIYKHLAKRNKLKLIKKLLKFYSNTVSEPIYCNLCVGAAKVNNMKILKLYIDGSYKPIIPAAAAKGNNLELITWLISKEVYPDYRAVEAAAQKGHVDIFKFLVHGQNCRLGNAYYCAALNNQHNILSHCFLHSDVCNIANGAARGGHLEILKLAYQRGSKLGVNFMCEHIHIFKWLIHNGHLKYNTSIAANIARSGNLPCLQFIHSQGYNIHSGDVFYKALLGGNVDMIKWLREINCPSNIGFAQDFMSQVRPSPTILKLLLDSDFLIHVDAHIPLLVNGDIEILKILNESLHFLDDKFLNAAVHCRHTHIVAWARQNKCNWSEETCNVAVKTGNLKMLRWLRGFDRNKYDLDIDENDICPWDSNVCLEAIGFGKVDILEFAIQNGCEFSSKCHVAVTESENDMVKDLVKKLIK